MKKQNVTYNKNKERFYMTDFHRELRSYFYNIGKVKVCYTDKYPIKTIISKVPKEIFINRSKLLFKPNDNKELFLLSPAFTTFYTKNGVPIYKPYYKDLLITTDIIAFCNSFDYIEYTDGLLNLNIALMSRFLLLLEKKKMLYDLGRTDIEYGLFSIREEYGDSLLKYTYKDIERDLRIFEYPITSILEEELSNINFCKYNLYCINRSNWTFLYNEDSSSFMINNTFYKRLKFILVEKEYEHMDSDVFTRINRRILKVAVEDRHMLLDCLETRYIIQDVDGNRIEKGYAYEKSEKDNFS